MSTKKEDQINLNLNYINIPIPKTDIGVYINLMHACSKTFEQLANYAAEQNDEATFNMYAARYKLIINFAKQLSLAASIGEPENNELH
jgi:hypothetical protein